MSQGKVLHASIGEIKIGRGDEELIANLGSCVGIALLWKQRGLYGLAHCLLPRPMGERVAAHEITGRFVTQAVPSLLALMRIRPAERREVSAVLVGGGNMTAPPGTAEKNLIGFQNAETAAMLLREHKLEIVFQETGGEAGRRIRVFCQTGEYIVQLIPRISSVAG
jgi:chemotaxis protein CheD